MLKIERDEVILVLAFKVNELNLEHIIFIGKIERSRIPKYVVGTEIEDIRQSSDGGLRGGG